METETVEQTEFRFSELSERAKQRAIERYAAADSMDWEPYLLEDLMPVIHAFGFRVETRTVRLHGGGTREEPDIHCDVGYRTSERAAFPGWWKAENVKVHMVLEDRPTDEPLRALAARMMVLFMRYPLGEARIRTTGRHDLDMELEDEYTGQQDGDGAWITLPDEDSAALRDILKDLCHWVWRQMQDDYEWHCSWDRAREELTQSDDLFDEDGDLL